MRLSRDDVERIIKHFLETTEKPRFTTLSGVKFIEWNGIGYADHSAYHAVSGVLAHSLLKNPTALQIQNVNKTVMNWLLAKPGDQVTEENVRIGMTYKLLNDPTRKIIQLGRSSDALTTGRVGFQEFQRDDGKWCDTHNYSRKIISLGEALPGPVQLPVELRDTAFGWVEGPKEEPAKPDPMRCPCHQYPQGKCTVWAYEQKYRSSLPAEASALDLNAATFTAWDNHGENGPVLEKEPEEDPIDLVQRIYANRKNDGPEVLQDFRKLTAYLRKVKNTAAFLEAYVERITAGHAEIKEFHRPRRLGFPEK